MKRKMLWGLSFIASIPFISMMSVSCKKDKKYEYEMNSSITDNELVYLANKTEIMFQKSKQMAKQILEKYSDNYIRESINKKIWKHPLSINSNLVSENIAILIDLSEKYKTFYDILFKDIFPFLLSEWKITDNEYKYFNIYNLKGLISWVNSKLLKPQQKVF